MAPNGADDAVPDERPGPPGPIGGTLTSEERAELVSLGGGTTRASAVTGDGNFPAAGADESGAVDADGEGEVSEPGKVIRIGSMLKQLLDEVRQAPLDQASRMRMREIYELSVKELSEGLSDDLSEELNRLSFPFGDEVPTEAELRVAQAQLVGWLEGLFHGIQATLFAQQMAARTQIEQMNQRGLPPGAPGGGGVGSGGGAYL